MKLTVQLLAGAACLAAAPAMAEILPVVDVTLDATTDLRSLAFAADGKLYASGNVNFTRSELLTAIVRLNADGSLDTTFGDGGIVTLDMASDAPIPDGRRRQQSFGIAELPDGDVLATVHGLDAQSGQSVYLLRFDDKGNQLVAPQWGDERGLVEVVFGWANSDNADFSGDVGPVDSAWNLWVDPSNPEHVVITGHGPAAKGTGRTDLDRYVVRLNAADGSLDETFNGGQPVTYHSTGTLADNNRRSVIEPDGAIVTAGFTNFGDQFGMHAVILRVLPDGRFDPDFGNFIEPAATGQSLGLEPRPGVAIINPFQVDGGMSEAYAAVRMPDGSYVTSGPGEATAEGGNSSLGYQGTVDGDLVSFRIAGNKLDTSWGNGGTQAIQSEGNGSEEPNEDSAGAVALPDGRTVHAGLYSGHPAVIVLTPEGQLDTTVSDDGILELPHEQIDVGFNAAFISQDGSRIAVTSDVHEMGTRLVILEVRD